MTTIDNKTTLHEFLHTRSQEKFADLVEHIHWVHSAARRMVKDAALAEDVTQAVFLLLWQHPEKVGGKSLPAWLFRVTRYCAANALRSEARRSKYERRAAAMISEQPQSDEAAWAGMEPLLERSVARLRQRDREVLLLRFYQGQSLSQIGGALGISEEAARKRVSTAVEKLRGMMRPAATPAASFAVVLTQRITHTAPTALKTKVLSTAGGAGVSGSVMGLAEGAKQMMWIAKVKTAILAAAIVTVFSGGGWVISQQMAIGSAAAPGAPAPAVTVPVIATSMPAAGEIDLSAPEKTMASFVDALRSGDAERTRRCLLEPKAATPINSAVDWNLAASRLLIEARKKFKVEVTGMMFNMLTIDAVAEMLVGGTSPDAVKNDTKTDTAELSVNAPPEAMALFQGGARQMVQMWSGAPIRFKKVGAEWKLDLEHSMAMKIQTQGISQEEGRRRAVEFLDAGNAVLADVTAQIHDGKIATLPQARAAVRTETQKALTERGVRGMGMMLVPADAVATP